MGNLDHINRRDFLKISTAIAGGLLVSSCNPFEEKYKALKNHPVLNVRLNPLLRIGEDNSIYIILSKVEMGQGIWTTLPMLMAEELDCDWNKIKVEHSPSGTAEDFLEPPVLKSTGGSETTKSEFDNYRLAGAMARTVLVHAASKRWGVPPEKCKTENGYVFVGKKRFSYGELATEAATAPLPENIKLRTPNEWKIIGRSQKKLDALEKVNGTATYGIDLQFPGLLTAVVAHAPVFGGTVKSLNDDQAKAIHGVRQIVQIPTGIAVIADDFWSAKKGRDALTIEWENGPNENMDSKTQLLGYRNLAEKEGKIIRKKGNVSRALKKAKATLTAEYTFPFLAHAPMEPLNCTVRIGQDTCEVWAGTQSPLLHQAEIAAFLGLKPEEVVFNTPYIGGSFGRKGSFSSDWVMEAVHVAKASGMFIKLVWTREDDIQGGYYRPVYLHRVQIGMGADDFPIAWHHRIVGQSLFVGTPLEELIVIGGIDYSSVTTASPYSDAIADESFELTTTQVGVPVLPWRSVGNTHTAFVVETLIDELATMAKTDPVVFRRTLLRNSPRHLSVLNLAAEKAEWNKPLAAGRFRGIAVHESMGSFVSQVVEISIDNNKIRIHRVVCAIDCGLAVNPDGVRAQLEGSIVFGLTAALYGEITIEKGHVQQSNFHNYPMLRMREMPVLDIHIVTSSEKMGGAGEPGVPPIGPALANAIFSATGRRLRNLPLRL